MREICTSGPVGGEGGNLLAYPALYDIETGSFRQNGGAELASGPLWHGGCYLRFCVAKM